MVVFVCVRFQLLISRLFHDFYVDMKKETCCFIIKALKPLIKINKMKKIQLVNSVFLYVAVGVSEEEKKQGSILGRV